MQTGEPGLKVADFRLWVFCDRELLILDTVDLPLAVNTGGNRIRIDGYGFQRYPDFNESFFYIRRRVSLDQGLTAENGDLFDPRADCLNGVGKCPPPRKAAIR